MKISQNAVLYFAGFIAVVGIIASTYLAIQGQDKDSQIETLFQERNTILQKSNNQAAELDVASTTIDNLQNELINIKEELGNLADDYRDERNRNSDFEDQIRSLSGTLGDLDKLAKTDKELLAKYSKVYFLNENYTPAKIKQIDSQYILEGKKDQYFHASAINHLEDLFKAAAKDGIDLKVISAYRSFDEQVDVKGQFTQVYGTGANAFSADQGYSEHQLGTTLDLTIKSVGGTYTSFAETEAYAWLLKNAYKYGFVLSYPKDNSFYIFEPWHWRFVGTELARDLNRSNTSFYKMEQRDIDKYLLNLFD